MRRLLFRLLVLGAVVAAIQVVLYRVALKRFVFREQATLDDCLDRHDDAIYFGDSTLETFEDNDPSRRGIPELLQEMTPELKIGSISHPGYHAAVYRAFGEYMLRRGPTPRAMIVTVNLHTFAPDADARPEHQFMSERIRLEHSPSLLEPFISALLTFKTWELTPLTHQQFFAIPVLRGNTVVGTVGQFDPDNPKLPEIERTRPRFIYQYMSALPREHRKIRDLAILADGLKLAGIRPVFYFTPIDHEEGERYFGREFVDDVRANVATITAVLAEHGVKALDLSFALPHARFIWKVIPDEHLDTAGRKFVASAVRANLLEQLAQSMPTGH